MLRTADLAGESSPANQLNEVILVRVRPPCQVEMQPLYGSYAKRHCSSGSQESLRIFLAGCDPPLSFTSCQQFSHGCASICTAAASAASGRLPQKTPAGWVDIRRTHALKHAYTASCRVLQPAQAQWPRYGIRHVHHAAAEDALFTSLYCRGGPWQAVQSDVPFERRRAAVRTAQEAPRQSAGVGSCSGAGVHCHLRPGPLVGKFPPFLPHSCQPRHALCLLAARTMKRNYKAFRETLQGPNGCMC